MFYLSLGCLWGALGRERTFIVYGRDDRLDLPTLLAGVTAATFARRADNYLEAALGLFAQDLGAR